MSTYATWLFLLTTLFLVLSTGCQSTATPEQGHENHADEMPALSPVTLGQGEKLQVVASTSIVADVVRNVGGDLIDLTTLMPLGADPHAFEPTPQDAAAVADAHVVFINGAGLELFLESLLQSAGAAEKVVSVSQGIELRRRGWLTDGSLIAADLSGANLRWAAVTPEQLEQAISLEGTIMPDGMKHE